MTQPSNFRFPSADTVLNGIFLVSIAVATVMSAVIVNLPTPVA